MKISLHFLGIALSLLTAHAPLQSQGGGPGSEPVSKQDKDLGDIVKAEDIFKHVSKDKGFVTLKTKAKDDLPLTADIYPGKSAAATMILLFHQAGSSRGEYRKIAPRLQAKGYNCLSLDARSGNGIRWGVTNVTSAFAVRRKLDQSYDAARQDLERSLAWVREMEFTGPIVLWGSSYSAALVLLMAQPKADGKKITGVVTFSPGEYLAKKGVVTKAVPKIEVPIFMTCSRAETQGTVGPFIKLMKNKRSVFFLPETGKHGSRFLTLTDSKEEVMKKDAMEAWKQVFAFLADVAPPLPKKGAAKGKDAADGPQVPATQKSQQPASRKGRD